MYDKVQVDIISLAARDFSVSSDPRMIIQSMRRFRAQEQNKEPHRHEVSCKLAKFLVSSAAKYWLWLSTCPECFLHGPFARSDTTVSLSCFAHWYSRYFQLAGPVCLPERNFAVFFRSPFYPPTLSPAPFPRARKYFLLYINCIRHAIADPSFVIARAVPGKQFSPWNCSREAFSLRFRGANEGPIESRTDTFRRELKS